MAHADPRSPNRTQPRPGTVLVVDDDPDIREAIAQVLEDEGYGTVSVGNGREALAYLRQESAPCCILLDLMMPVMNGFAFRAEQQQDAVLSSIPVVVLTADPNAHDRAAELQASAWLQKPAALDDLLDAVSAFCNAD